VASLPPVDGDLIRDLEQIRHESVSGVALAVLIDTTVLVAIERADSAVEVAGNEPHAISTNQPVPSGPSVPENDGGVPADATSETRSALG
jgi:hypothetical protein